MSGKEITPGPAFDPQELGFQLAARPVPRLHRLHGEGFHYALGPDKEEPQADLEVYPQTRLIRYSSEGLSIVMQGETISGSYEGESVVFSAITDRESRLMTINPFGEVLLTSSMNPPLAGETEPPKLTMLAEPSAVAAEPPDLSLKQEKEKQQRVALVGRAGRDASLRQTAKGVDIAKFPLAVHEQGEDGADTTVWHQIVTFNGLAKEVADTVKKGSEYKVIGYKHERQDQDKTIAEIYAATVKPPTKRPNGGTAEEGPKASAERADRRP